MNNTQTLFISHCSDNTHTEKYLNCQKAYTPLIVLSVLDKKSHSHGYIPFFIATKSILLQKVIPEFIRYANFYNDIKTIKSTIFWRLHKSKFFWLEVYVKIIINSMNPNNFLPKFYIFEPVHYGFLHARFLSYHHTKHTSCMQPSNNHLTSR